MKWQHTVELQQLVACQANKNKLSDSIPVFLNSHRLKPL